MSAPDEPLYHLGTRNHLFVAPGLRVIGQLPPRGERLLERLNRKREGFLDVLDAEVFTRGTSEHAARVRIATETIHLAHEYVDLAGDPHLRQHSTACTVPGSLHPCWPPGARIRGRFRPERLDSRPPFFAVLDPKLEGFDAETQAALSGLPYLIVNRDRLQLVIEDASPRRGEPPHDP